MLAINREKSPRTISAGEAAGLVKSGMWLDYGGTLCQPDVFDKALAARLGEVTDINIRAAITMKPRAVLEADPEARHVNWVCLHFSGYDRRKHDAGICHYMPLNLGEVPDFYRRFIDPVDIVVLKARPMDESGWFNFGPTGLYHRALVERARTVIIEVNDGLPHVHGEGNGVHVSEIDHVIEGDNQPPAELPNPAPTEIDRAVGRFITNEIGDGACLQIGIGGMPNAVCAALLDSGVKDLGIHTEMLTDGLIDLYAAGRITNTRKKVYPGKLAFTFALGSRKLYEAVDRNPDMLCLPSDMTNAPDIIMRNDDMVSINNTTSIDLTGQAASESDGHRHISGTGGQLQFVRGAYASKGGKSFICLASTYDRRGERKSRIALELKPGTTVTTPRTDTMYAVTEYGAVNLKGKSIPERARALISIAHPDFRDDLSRQARQHGLLPRGALN